MRPRPARATPRPAPLAPAGAVVVALMLAPAGCMVGPEYERPGVTLPEAYRASATRATESETAARVLAAPDNDGIGTPTMAAPDASLRAWWARFDDPALTALVDRVMASNLDLESAAARLDRSRALLGLSRADLVPSATGEAGASRSRTSEEVDQGPGQAGGRTSNRASMGLVASWEIDLFGGRRRAVQAARAELEAAEADLHAVRISVSGEVADAYVARLGALDRLAIARQTVESYRDTLGLTRARAAAGLVSDLDAALAEAELDAAIAAIPALRTEVALQENRIAALLATTPEEVAALLGSASTTPDAPAIEARGVPLDLLRRRPDVVAAERRVASASASIGAEVAEYFPRVSLVGDVGLAASDAGDLLTSGARTWSAGPTLRWRILDFARIDSAVLAARAEERGAIAAYRQSIVEAVRDVEDAAARFDDAGAEMAARATALASRQRAFVVAEAQYTAGLSEFLPVLDATRGVNQARSDLALSRERRARAAVALFRALGGGWEGPEDAASHGQDEPAGSG